MVDLWPIRSAMRDRLIVVSGIAKERIAWEGRPFTPPDGAPWLRETMHPLTERWVAFDRMEALGTLQVDAFLPTADLKIKDADTLADRIKAGFAPGTAFLGSVHVDRAWRGPAIPEPGWLHIPVFIRWRAYASA